MLLNEDEENRIREILKEKANEYNLIQVEEDRSLAESNYIDTVWYKNIENESIPVVAFEIEKDAEPNSPNERLKKNIFNLLLSRAPVGYIILPHSRAIKIPRYYWYINRFPITFENYYKPFKGFIKINLSDADVVLETKKLIPLNIQKDWNIKLK